MPVVKNLSRNAIKAAQEGTKVTQKQGNARPYAGADSAMDRELGTINCSQMSSNEVNKPELLVGDLVWSKIPGHAWWPSMVSYEPNKAVYFQISGKGKSCYKYHVQFFGDEPQRGWVSDKSMIKFQGRDSLMVAQNGSANKKDKSAHSKQLGALERALEQAEKALPLNRQQRKLCYVFKYNDEPDVLKTAKKSPETQNKKKEKAPKKTNNVKRRITRRSLILDTSSSVPDLGSNDNVRENPAEKESTHNDSQLHSASCQLASLRARPGRFGKDKDIQKDTNCNLVPETTEPAKEPEVLEQLSQESPNNVKLDRSALRDKRMNEVKRNKSEGFFDNYHKSIAEHLPNGYGALKMENPGFPNRKRQLRLEKIPLPGSSKRIKLEIFDDNIDLLRRLKPKILKNKQTQTPERGRKKGTKHGQSKLQLKGKLKAVTRQILLSKDSTKNTLHKGKSKMKESKMNNASKSVTTSKKVGGRKTGVRRKGRHNRTINGKDGTLKKTLRSSKIGRKAENDCETLGNNSIGLELMADVENNKGTALNTNESLQILQEVIPSEEIQNALSSHRQSNSPQKLSVISCTNDAEENRTIQKRRKKRKKGVKKGNIKARSCFIEDISSSLNEFSSGPLIATCETIEDPNKDRIVCNVAEAPEVDDLLAGEANENLQGADAINEILYLDFEYEMPLEVDWNDTKNVNDPNVTKESKDTNECNSPAQSTINSDCSEDNRLQELSTGVGTHVEENSQDQEEVNEVVILEPDMNQDPENGASRQDSHLQQLSTGVGEQVDKDCQELEEVNKTAFIEPDMNQGAKNCASKQESAPIENDSNIFKTIEQNGDVNCTSVKHMTETSHSSFTYNDELIDELLEIKSSKYVSGFFDDQTKNHNDIELEEDRTTWIDQQVNDIQSDGPGSTDIYNHCQQESDRILTDSSDCQFPFANERSEDGKQDMASCENDDAPIADINREEKISSEERVDDSTNSEGDNVLQQEEAAAETQSYLDGNDTQQETNKVCSDDVFFAETNHQIPSYSFSDYGKFESNHCGAEANETIADSSTQNLHDVFSNNFCHLPVTDNEKLDYGEETLFKQPECGFSCLEPVDQEDVVEREIACSTDDVVNNASSPDVIESSLHISSSNCDIATLGNEPLCHPDMDKDTNLSGNTESLQESACGINVDQISETCEISHLFLPKNFESDQPRNIVANIDSSSLDNDSFSIPDRAVATVDSVTENQEIPASVSPSSLENGTNTVMPDYCKEGAKSNGDQLIFNKSDETTVLNELPSDKIMTGEHCHTTSAFDNSLTDSSSSVFASPDRNSLECDESKLQESSSKRLRKRKTMSDFHVGLAFDAVLSKRSRSSEKESSKACLSKRSKQLSETVKKIDFNEFNTQNPVTNDVCQDNEAVIAPKKKRGRPKKVDSCKDAKSEKEVNTTSKNISHQKENELHRQKSKIGGRKGLKGAIGQIPSTPNAEMASDSQSVSENRSSGLSTDLTKSQEQLQVLKKTKKYVRRKETSINDISKLESKVPGRKKAVLMQQEASSDIQQCDKDSTASCTSGKAESMKKKPGKQHHAEKMASKVTGKEGENTAGEKSKLKRKSKAGKKDLMSRSNLQNGCFSTSLDDNEELNELTSCQTMSQSKKGRRKTGQGANVKRFGNNKKQTSTEIVESIIDKDNATENDSDSKVKTKRKYTRKKSLAETKSMETSSKTVVSSEASFIDSNSIYSRPTDVVGSTEAVVNNTKSNNPASSCKRSYLKKSDRLEIDSNHSDQIEESLSASGRDGEDGIKIRRENVCVICEQGDNLISCNGVCLSSFHPDCLGLSTVPEKFYCDECLTGNHSCFSCKETGKLRKCNQTACGKFFHDECAAKMPVSKFESNKLYCPLHYCATCTNEKDSIAGPKKKLLRCVRCPTAYHASSCLVAGCMQLTSSLMVCHKHFVPNKSKPHHAHYNVSWCFVCSSGGMLVCCESCPAAFHPGCVDELDGIPEDSWQCDSCRNGKRPLYGDLVWVKYGFWRWWPAKICFPDEIPVRIQRLSHDVGEFPVMFFGSRDYCWLHSGRVFPYQEGDKGCKGRKTNGTHKIFQKAIAEVEEAYKELKEIRDKQLEQRLAKQCRKPPPYKFTKCNKYITAIRTIMDPGDLTHCECSVTADNPCGPGSECLNRMLQIECDKTCPAGDKCQNQRFQKCQHVDCVPLKTSKCGWGLKTKQDIKKGDFVIEYVGELIDDATCRKRINDYHDNGIMDYYFLVIDKDCIIDAYPKGNQSRFMNHSCDPNCDTQKWTVNGEIRVGLFANKDISAGSELTFNYNLDTLGNEKKVCQCGSKNCSGFLGVRPKTQNALALKEKKKKSKKKRKFKKDKMNNIRHEDECFACGDGGELIMCDKGSCSKCYHLKCLTLSGMPRGKWDCPWHFCDVCGKKATIFCHLCPNSFCAAHADGEIFEISDGIFICDEHHDDDIIATMNGSGIDAALLMPSTRKTLEISDVNNEENLFETAVNDD